MKKLAFLLIAVVLVLTGCNSIKVDRVETDTITNYNNK